MLDVVRLLVIRVANTEIGHILEDNNVCIVTRVVELTLVSSLTLWLARRREAFSTYSLTFSAPNSRIRPSYTHSADALTGNARNSVGPRPRKNPRYPPSASICRAVAVKDGRATVCGVAIMRLEQWHVSMGANKTHRVNTLTSLCCRRVSP